MEILKQSLFENTYLTWLMAIGTGVLSVALLLTLQWMTRKRLAKLASQATTQWDDYLVKVISGTRLLFWLMFGVLMGSLLLQLPENLEKGITVAFVIALLIQAGIWGGILISAAVNGYQEKTREENPAHLPTLGLLGLVGQIAVWFSISASLTTHRGTSYN